jgi:7-carboxy-7-deazaguanine synthase
MNTQPIEKRVALPPGGFLEVHSIFMTIQGEGPFSGMPAVFIRLAGCNLQCPKCDTDYTSQRTTMTVLEIQERVRELASAGCDLVVVTGGEPFRQELTSLFNSLTGMYNVQVETNGTLQPPEEEFFTYRREASPNVLGRHVYIVCSPKTGKVHPRIQELACAFKYVITSGDVSVDGLPFTALGHTAAPFVARPSIGRRVHIIVQPCDDKDPDANALNVQACIESAMGFGYRLQLQTHKLLEVE